MLILKTKDELEREYRERENLEKKINFKKRINNSLLMSIVVFSISFIICFFVWGHEYLVVSLLISLLIGIFEFIFEYRDGISEKDTLKKLRIGKTQKEEETFICDKCNQIRNYFHNPNYKVNNTLFDDRCIYCGGEYYYYDFCTVCNKIVKTRKFTISNDKDIFSRFDVFSNNNFYNSSDNNKGKSNQENNKKEFTCECGGNIIKNKIICDDCMREKPKSFIYNGFIVDDRFNYCQCGGKFYPFSMFKHKN